MNTAHFTKYSNPQSESSDLQFTQDSTVNDSFGIKAAGMDALKEKPLFMVFSAKILNWLLMFAGLLPFALIVLLPVLAISDSTSSTLNYATAIFLVWVVAFVANQLRLVNKKPNLMQPMETQKDKRESVVVIGAGPVGLAVVKECMESGLDVKCYESKSGLGGVYRFEKDKPSGVWKSARLTSSPWVTAFSDFPPSSPSSIQHTHKEYVDYLESYTDHFNLRSNIHFNTMVEKVEKSDEGWSVTIRDMETESVETIECDRVAICSGVHQTPKPISIPGSDNFTGKIDHVANYKGPEDFAGKKVVVAGLGESGADITHELSKVAQKVVVSISRGKFVIPRINPLTGKANDYDTNRIRNAAPVFLKNGFMSLKRRLCAYIGHHTPESAVRAKLLQVSERGPNTQTATKSDEFIKCILDGSLNIAREIVCFDNNEVVFADGKREAADVVLFAHGYMPEFPFLELPTGLEVKHPSEMYLSMFDPEVGNSLAFFGFARPALGSIPPVGELQARLFARVAAGQLILPAKEEMQYNIKIDQRENRERFPGLPKHNVVVSWIPYMDKLATLIGCRPNPWKLISSPVLLWRVVTGAVNGAHYRLHGVGAKPIAKQTVYFLKGEHDLTEVLTMLGLHFWVWPLGLIQKNKRFQSDISSI